MKKFLRFVESRLFITALLLLVQLLILLLGLRYLFNHFAIYYVISTAISIISIIDIANDPMNPSFKTPWIILVLLIPFCGAPLYLLFSKSKQNYRVDKKLKNKKSVGKSKRSTDPIIFENLSEFDPKVANQLRYIENADSAPVYMNTLTKYFSSGEEYFDALKRELKRAERFIFLEYFIIEQGVMFDSILDILSDKVKQGIEVRIMYDDFGTISKVPSDFERKLESLGLRVCVFNRLRPSLDTFQNYRDHRKIVVIDGNVGFTGGINLADEYINEVQKFGHWKDTGIMLKGEAVTKLTDIFLSLWSFSKNETKSDVSNYESTLKCSTDGFVQPFSDGPLNDDEICKMCYMGIINNASETIHITTPYLILDNEMITALCYAAKSGVDVKIITPHIPDKKLVLAVTRSNYRELLKAGVKIYEYTPGFIHAKSIVSDRKICVVGTANFDFRSLYLHFENCVLAYNSNCVSDVEDDFLQTLEKCEEITLSQLDKKGYPYRILQAFLKIFSPLM